MACLISINPGEAPASIRLRGPHSKELHTSQPWNKTRVHYGNKRGITSRLYLRTLPIALWVRRLPAFQTTGLQRDKVKICA